MSRTIAAGVKEALEAPDSVDALLAFLVITHPSLPDPIRVVSDVMDYVVGVDTFLGLPFEFGILSDVEGPPQTELKMQNVDARIGRALLALNDRAKVTLTIRSSADFNLSQDPRVELGGGSVIYEFRDFDLIDVTGTVGDISGRVMLRDYSQEPWPGQRCTQSRMPGLFR
jgi:Domain of unknown function (DUF1833)